MATQERERPAVRERPPGERPGRPPRRRNERLGGVNAGALVAELVGTFLFVWLGTGTLLAAAAFGGPSAVLSVGGDVAISLAFGLALMVAVFATAPISGAHLNPAVTFALACFGKFPWVAAPFYWVAQFVGAACAGLANWFLFGGGPKRSQLLLGATQPGARGWHAAIFAEFLLTAVLMLTIMVTAVDEKRSPGPVAAGLAIGLVVGAGIFAMLPVSGGSFNPARTLGPMIASQKFAYWWVYFAGPVAGAVFGAGVYVLAMGRGWKPGEGRLPDRGEEA